MGLFKVGRFLGRVLLGRSGARRGPLLRLGLLGVVVALLAASCAEGTYPLDFFYEMHYQPTYHSQEPPRLMPAAQSVPVTGREVPLTLDDVSTITNPIPGQGIERGAELFDINCSMCHGIAGRGDGQVLKTMIETYGYVPKLSPDLPTVKLLPDGFLFSIISNRDLILTDPAQDKVMPQFQKLLTVEERWMLVNYIKTLPGL